MRFLYPAGPGKDVGLSLLNSQMPLLLCMKFVDVHNEYRRHNLLHVSELRHSKFFTTSPSNGLFSCDIEITDLTVRSPKPLSAECQKNVLYLLLNIDVVIGTLSKDDEE